MKIIGIGGTNGSGKDTVAQILKEKAGYFVGSATDMLGAELIKRGLPTDRAHKRELSAQWRREYGLAVIVDRAVEEAKSKETDKVVIGSLRNPGEADRIHELGGAMVWVDADPHIRYERITNADRGRVEDNRTFEEFMADEEAEMHQSGDTATLNMSSVKEKSDIFIENSDSNMAVFEEQIMNALEKYI